MSKESKVVKSCANCYCKPVCKYFSTVIGSFRNATRDMTDEIVAAASEAVSVPLAKKCTTFSSVDERDFNLLQAENEDLKDLMASLKRKLSD